MEEPTRWMLNVTAFLVFFIEMGTLKSYGVLFDLILPQLQCSSSVLGFAMGLTHATAFLLSPVTGNIVRRVDHRVCVIVGGLVQFGGLFSGVFCRNVYELSLAMALAGIGVGLSYFPQVLILLKVYPTRFPFMYGAVSIGGSIGMMVMPPITEAVVEAYGWRGTLLIIAAINANVCFLGALQRPPRCRSENGYAAVSVGETDGSDPTTSTTSTTGEELSDTCWVRFHRAVLGAASWLSFGIYAQVPGVLLHHSIWLLEGVVFSAWMVFLVPHTAARGIPRDLAVFASTAGGIGNLIGRVLHPVLFQKKLASPFWLFVVLSLVNGCTFLLDYLSGSNYVLLLALAGINGAAIGTSNIILVSVSKQLYGTQYLVDIYLIGNVFYGCGEFLGSFSAGAFYDWTRNYDASFFAMGLLSVAMAVMFLLDRYAKRELVDGLCQKVSLKSLQKA